MRSQRAVSQQGSASPRKEPPKPRSETTSSKQQPGERDAFLDIQAESGRRMRPVVAEHYGEAE